MNSPGFKRGWLTYDVSESEEQWARAFRAERDRAYGNVFVEEDTDERWVGDLGEHVFDRWLLHHKGPGYKWVVENAAGKPDFVLASGIQVGVKTVKRGVAPQEYYTAQVTTRHINEPSDYFFFLSYEIAQRRMWLLGGIECEKFRRLSKYCPAGTVIHPSYTVRAGHEINNIEVKHLMLPDQWLQQV